MMQQSLALLPRERTLLVALHAPLEVLLERAAARSPEDQRLIRRQFPLVHRDVAYDLELATAQESPRSLAARVLARVGMTPRSLPPHDALAGLRPLEVGDHATFARAAQAGGCRGWLYYFPFLHLLSRTVRRELRWEEVGGSVLVYHMIDADQGPRLGLYLPPFPFSAVALSHARERCRRFDPAAPLRILWVEDAQLAALSGILASKRQGDTELAYDGARVASLAGSGFAHLRDTLAALERVPGLAVRPYLEQDRVACEAVIDAWRGQRKAERANSSAYRLALLCLDHHGAFDADLLRGEVVTQEGEVRAITFGGPIGDGVGSIFVAIDDRRLPGLDCFQRFHFLRCNPDIRLWRELRDLDGPRLVAVKQAFEPVASSPLWRVVLQDGDA
jgi:hypothetical protein